MPTPSVSSISTICDCSCHKTSSDRRGGACECFCAPCAFCRQPVRLIFLKQHQEICGAAWARVEHVRSLAGELQEPI